MKSIVLISAALALASCADVPGADPGANDTEQTVQAITGRLGGRATDGNSSGGIWTLNATAPVGPAPGTGYASPTTTADYGMCAVVEVAGYLDKNSKVQVTVNSSGYFQLTVTQSTTGRPVNVPATEGYMTCVHLSDFTSAPSPTTAVSTLQTLSATGTAASNTTTPVHACQWQGIAGPFSPTTTDIALYQIYSNARYVTGPDTLLAVLGSGSPTEKLWTGAFCTDYTGGTNWNGLTLENISQYSSSTFISTSGTNFVGHLATEWCYLEGVNRYPDAGISGNVSMTIDTATNPGTGNVEYYASAGNGALWYNCLKLTH